MERKTTISRRKLNPSTKAKTTGCGPARPRRNPFRRRTAPPTSTPAPTPAKTPPELAVPQLTPPPPVPRAGGVGRPPAPDAGHRGVPRGVHARRGRDAGSAASVRRRRRARATLPASAGVVHDLGRRRALPAKSPGSRRTRAGSEGLGSVHDRRARPIEAYGGASATSTREDGHEGRHPAPGRASQPRPLTSTGRRDARRSGTRGARGRRAGEEAGISVSAASHATPAPRRWRPPHRAEDHRRDQEHPDQREDHRRHRRRAPARLAVPPATSTASSRWAAGTRSSR